MRSKKIIYVFLLFIGIRLLYLDFVPIWDGASVTNCVLNSIKPKFNPAELNCHHPSIGYLSLLGISQWLEWGNHYLLSFTHLLLGLLGLYSFYKIVRFLFSRSDENQATNVALMVALLAFNPLFFANSLTPSLDFGVTVFFLTAIYSFIYQYKAQAILAMTFMILSKETGMVLYIAIILGLIATLIANRLKKKSIQQSTLQQVLLYLIPLVIFLIHILIQKTTSTRSIFWTSSDHFSFQISQLTRLWISRSLTRIIQTFVLDFHWIYTLIILFGANLFARKYFRFGIRTIFNTLIKNVNLLWLIVVSSFIFYGVAIFAINTYTLPRYVLPLVPLLILISVKFIIKLATAKKSKLILLFIFIVSFIQTFKTIDPVSQFIFGTFNFGNHKMLTMISHVNECCGIAGKDQLSYNAEFTVIHRLINKLYQEIRLSPDLPLIIGNLDAAELFISADMHALNRTLKTQGIIVPTVYISNDLQFFKGDELPKQAIFVYLPWSDILSEEYSRISKFYNPTEAKIIEYQGYQISYYRLIRK